jgi:hypothetical protein
MASASDIAQVRRNTGEPTTTNYTDQVISDYIDVVGVAGASARIWEEKAATWADLVNTTEAGASHAFSDLNKNATAQAKYWHDQELKPTTGPVVHTIERRT